MCGICCSVSFSVEHFSKDLKEDLLYNLSRRGPSSSKQLLKSSVSYQCVFSGHVLHLRGVLTAQPVEGEREDVFLWNGEVFSGIKVEAEENDTQIMFNYLSSCKNESDILSLFSKVQGPWSFMYYQASSHHLWFGRDFFGRRSLLWHFSNLDKSFCLSSVGPQIPGEASQWQEVPASGIFRIDLKSASISKSVVLKLYPWQSVSGENVIKECVNSLIQVSADLPTFVSVVANEAGLHLKDPVVPLNRTLRQAPLEMPRGTIVSVPPTRETLQMFLTDRHMKEVVQQFLEVLSLAVQRRVSCLPRDTNLTPSAALEMGARRANVAVLFSGGVDSMVLAALADLHIPLDEPIDLLNVAFATKEKTVLAGFNQKRKNQKSRYETPSKESSGDDATGGGDGGVDRRFGVPDRVTGRAGLKELQAANPSRIWNFVEINVSLEELQELRRARIRHLVQPLDTVLDDSIGCAVWFAARGAGWLVAHGDTGSYRSSAKVGDARHAGLGISET